MPDLITPLDLTEACEDLALLPYFPADGKPAIMRQLAAMCPHREALKWLVQTAINQVRTWPGPAELRGILCTRYDAADGVDTWSTLPGFTAEDGEAKFLESHEALKLQSAETAAALLAEIGADAAQLGLRVPKSRRSKIAATYKAPKGDAAHATAATTHS